MRPAELRPEEILGVAQLGCPSTWQDHKIQCRQEATEMLPATLELVNLITACIEGYEDHKPTWVGIPVSPHWTLWPLTLSD